MRRFSASDIVLKVVGLLLLTAAVLKGHELLTVPLANKDLWSWRPCLIFQVEFELALGIWLLSGVFKRLAWLAALTCFSLFCCVTLYKGLSGAASCGCFGRIHVNPWVTLLAVDLPAVALLLVMRPRGVGAAVTYSRTLVACLINLSWHAGRRAVRQSHSHVRTSLDRVLVGIVSVRVLATTAIITVVLGTAAPVLVLREPPKVTARYEVLEPKTWVGKELPIAALIDIADRLRQGAWLLVFYHHDCRDCQRVLPQYERTARDLAGNEDLLRVAMIAMPPYGEESGSDSSPCVLGRMAASKEWFLATPVTVLIEQGKVTAVWETEAPDLEIILAHMA